MRQIPLHKYTDKDKVDAIKEILRELESDLPATRKVMIIHWICNPVSPSSQDMEWAKKWIDEHIEVK